MARWLIALEQMPSEQKMKAHASMQRVPIELRAAVIEQWLHRCASGGVRNPLAYLLSCVQRAIQGDFNADWRPESPPPTSSPKPQTPVGNGPAPGVAISERVPGPQPPRSTENVRTAREQLMAMQHILSPRSANQASKTLPDAPQ